MTSEEGMSGLIRHADTGPDAFLDMLRPYGGGLREDVLTNVMACLRASASLFGEDRVPRELMSAVWSISHLGRLWGLDEQGMLRRNQLISADDVVRLKAFIDEFDFAVGFLLDGVSEEMALSE